MYYPEEVIEQIREQSDILSIISEYTHLTKKGNSHFGLCPFHNEKTPSFSVNEEKQMYYCFGCGAGGNTITFLMQKENMTFVEAVKYLAEKAHISLEEASNTKEERAKINHKNELLEIHTEAARFFYMQLNQPENSKILEYLLKRGLKTQTIKHFGIGYAPSDYTILYNHLKQKGYSEESLLQSGLINKSKKSSILYDRFSDRIMFPIFNLQKRVIAFGGRVLGNEMPKYLNSPESILFNKSVNLYGLNFAKSVAHEAYILVEGYMDVIAMHQAGFPQTVASLGTAFTSSHAKLLKRYTKEVIIMYDTDNAGVNATMRAIPILKKEGLKVKVLQLEGAKDPDEYMKEHGNEKMQALLQESKSDTWFKIHRLEGQYDTKNTDQKIMFLQEVSSVIGGLESSIEQDIYISEIANKYDMTNSALEAEVKKYYNRSLSTNVPTRKTATFVKPVNMQTNAPVVLLSAIYHYPYIYDVVKDHVFPELFEDELLQELAVSISAYLEKGTPIDMGYYSAKYPEVGEQNMISNILLNRDSRYEDKQLMEKMINESVKRLNKTFIEHRLKNVTDVSQVQILLSKKKELDRLYIALING